MSDVIGSFPSDVDPERVRYEVEVDDGFINAAERDTTRGLADYFTAMSPNDARQLAAMLIEAARMAEKHSRWRS